MQSLHNNQSWTIKQQIDDWHTDRLKGVVVKFREERSCKTSTITEGALLTFEFAVNEKWLHFLAHQKYKTSNGII